MTQITINDREVDVVEYKGQRVITFRMMDELHKRPEGTARKRFNDNKSKLAENEDYWEISQASEIRTLGFERQDGSTPAKIILLSDSGYSMLVKSFTDDLAWEVQKALVRSYFKPAVAIADETPEALAFRAIIALQGKVEVMEEQAKLQEAMLSVARPKAEALDTLASMRGFHSLTQAAKGCSWPRDAFIEECSRIKWIYRDRAKEIWMGYSEKERAGYLDYKPFQYTSSDGKLIKKPQVVFTDKGLAKICEIFAKKEKPVPFTKAPA